MERRKGKRWIRRHHQEILRGTVSKVTFKNSELLSAVQGLNRLMQEKMPVKLSLKTTRIAKVVNGEAESIDKVIKEVRERYTEKDSAGKPIVPVDKDGNELTGSIKLSDPKAYEKEVTELLEDTVTVEVERLTLADLTLKDAKGKERELEPFIFFHLGPLFVENEEANTEDSEESED